MYVSCGVLELRRNKHKRDSKFQQSSNVDDKNNNSFAETKSDKDLQVKKKCKEEKKIEDNGNINNLKYNSSNVKEVKTYKHSEQYSKSQKMDGLDENYRKSKSKRSIYHEKRSNSKRGIERSPRKTMKSFKKYLRTHIGAKKSSDKSFKHRD